MRQIAISRQLVAAAVGAVCAAQQTGGAANLLINGSLALGGVATLAAQQQLGFTSAGNIAAVVFTITGTDDQGRVISENVTGVNANTVNTVLNYRTVTKISTSAAVGTNVTVDSLQVGASQEVPLDRYLNPFSVSISVAVTGVINYTVQWTTDDVWSNPGGPFTWFSAAANLTGATTTQAGSLVSPVTAVRLLNNSGGGSAIMRVIQSGAVG